MFEWMFSYISSFFARRKDGLFTAPEETNSTQVVSQKGYLEKVERNSSWKVFKKKSKQYVLSLCFVLANMAASGVTVFRWSPKKHW